jgi:hypothetical protein
MRMRRQCHDRCSTRQGDRGGNNGRSPRKEAASGKPYPCLRTSMNVRSVDAASRDSRASGTTPSKNAPNAAVASAASLGPERPSSSREPVPTATAPPIQERGVVASSLAAGVPALAIRVPAMSDPSRYCCPSGTEDDAMSYIWGPVPSCQFGRSLGVDLLPFKTYPYDCVYCHLGRADLSREIDRRITCS